MTDFGRANLMSHEREIYDQVLAESSAAGTDALSTLLKTCDDGYYGARVAEAIGGEDCASAFRSALREQRLDEPGNQRDDAELVRGLGDGRIGVVRAAHDGYLRVEFAGGVETVLACDTQAVGPDPEMVQRAALIRQDAHDARRNAAMAFGAQAKAAYMEDAEAADRVADRLWAESMDWLAEPGFVDGFQGRQQQVADDDTDGM